MLIERSDSKKLIIIILCLNNYYEGDKYNNSHVFIRVPEEGIDLYSLKEEPYLKLGDTLAYLTKTDAVFDEVETWIKSNDLDKIKP